MRFRNTLLISALGCAFLLSACGGGGSGGGGAVIPIVAAPQTPASPTPAPATGRVVLDAIQSARTGATYPLSIYVPPSYDGSAAKFPIIYALDGDAANPPRGRFENLKGILEQRHVEAILIGIGGTSRRNTDYTFPGAAAYHDFLTKELVPFIESKYRADTGKRMLTGHSLSGSMTGYALFLEGASGVLTFSYFLSFEGSYGFQQGQTDGLEQAMYDVQKGNTLPATLILARCTDTTSCNYQPVDNVYQKLLKRAYAGFTLVEKDYSNGHVPTDLPAFSDAMAMIFP